MTTRVSVSPPLTLAVSVLTLLTTLRRNPLRRTESCGARARRCIATFRQLRSRSVVGWMAQTAVVRDYRTLEIRRRQANRLILTVSK
jgi:hypothetical protein